MIKRQRPWLARLLPAALLSFCTTLASAGDLETHKSFDIAPQSLDSALLEFSAQADIQLIVAAESLEGIESPGVSGHRSAAAALTALLEDTGLEYDRVGSTVTVKSARREEDPRSGKARPAPVQSRMARTATPAETRPRSMSRHSKSETETHGNGWSARVPLEEIVVVGTLLRDTSPTSPVISLDRADIERGGYTSIEDVLAKTPQNFNGVHAGTALVTGGNVGHATQVDLRGLGPEATLTLVNGRRISSGAGDDGRAVDISMIPIAAIQRIDILTDGASALYGSDAIGGVVNVVLRKDFEGAQTTVQYGDNSTGSDDFLAAQVIGNGWGSGRLLAAAQYVRNDSLEYRGIGIESLDFRARGGGDHRLQFAGSPGTVLPGGFFAGMPFTTLAGPGGTPVFSTALPDGDGRGLQLDELKLNEVTYVDLPYDEVMPMQESYSGYLTVEQDAGPVTLFADGVFARRETQSTLGHNMDVIYVPATNAFSPFAEDVYVGYRFMELPPVEYDNVKKGWFANFGARGSFGVSGWSWQVAGTISEDAFDNRFPSIDRAALDGRLASADPANAFNPFGDGSGQSPGVVDELGQQNAFDGQTTLRSIAAQAQGRLLELPGGSLRVALGAEFREEDMESGVRREGAPDSEYYPEASRDSGALFGEFYLPLVGESNAGPAVRELALSAAVRLEDYSDFGNTTNPKLGLLWRPTEDLAIKANWGTSFRAPSLRQLFATSSVNPNIPVLDPNAPGGPATAFADVVQGGNPDLDEETADTWSLSGEYRPAWLDGATFSATYYRIEYENRIRGLLDGLDWTTLLQFEDGLPAGIVVRAPDGTLQTVNATNLNSASTSMAGYDLAVDYVHSTENLGTLGFDALATFTTKYDDQLLPGSPVFEFAGRVGSVPEWRGRFSVNWQLRSWSAIASINHIDGLTNDDNDPGIVLRDVSSQTTVDVQFGYSFDASNGNWLRGVTARLGATNLLDDRPPFVDGPRRFGIDVMNSVVKGRTVYLRLAKSFGAAADAGAY